MFKTKDNIIALLDLGTSKIVAMVVKLLPELEILGFSYKKAAGIRAGKIVDLEKAQEAIKEALEEAEREAATSLTKVFLGLSSQNLLSKIVRYEIKLHDKAISEKDIKSLLLEVFSLCQNEKLEILHSFACDYTLDGTSVLVNPLGLYGERLACDFHLIVAPLKSLLNIQTALEKSGLEIGGYVATGYAAGLSVLSSQEREEGVILIDFGAGTTSLSVFLEEKLIYLDSLPFGGDLITKDIATVLSISWEEAERIKTLYGGLLATDADRKEMVIELDEGQALFRADLIAIIQARLEEILTAIMPKLEPFPYKIVITGGVARTLRLNELMIEFFERKVIVGKVSHLNLVQKSRNDMELSTSFGLLKHLENSYKLTLLAKAAQGNKGKNFVKWLQETFFASNAN